MADRVQLNRMTVRAVGDRGIVNSLRGDFWADGREAIVTETHQQHSTNGYRAVTVTVLRVEGKYPRHDDLTIPNEWFGAAPGFTFTFSGNEVLGIAAALERDGNPLADAFREAHDGARFATEVAE